jgi:hypothetical protein
MSFDGHTIFAAFAVSIASLVYAVRTNRRTKRQLAELARRRSERMRILPISTLPIATLLASMSANAADALPTVVVSCATPHPEFPRQVSLDVYELYGTSASSRCVYTNKGAGMHWICPCTSGHRLTLELMNRSCA